MNLDFFGRYFKLTLLAILAVEILSYSGYVFPIINSIFFWLIVLITLVLSLIKLEYGLYILLAELFISSKGYLFHFDVGGLSVSIRIALFLVVLGVWLFHLIKTKKLEFEKSNLFKWYLALFIFIVWGTLWGILRGNEFNNIFFDVNGYLYFGLIFVFFAVINSLEKVSRVFQVLLAAVITTFIKTILLLYIFSHKFIYVMPSLYRWVRTTGVGEITAYSGNFYRIFFQTQIYSLVVFFILLILLILVARQKFRKKDYTLMWLIGIFTSSVILISFSRSFWAGIVAGLLLLYIFLIFKARFSWRKILGLTGIIIIIGGLELGGIFSIVNFPLPSKGEVASASLIKERAMEIEGEVGASSRLELLPSLIKKIEERPILGSGFGTTVTYRSSDPRNLINNPSGLYTTYAFEWGYLDIWVKIGILGLLIYLGLIFKVFQNGWRIFRDNKNIVLKALSLGLLLGLAALIVINLISPYLNHPLGIGFLMLCSVIFYILEKEKFIQNQEAKDDQ